MGTITYENKVAINENTSVADVNKVKATDMNEIKNAVNDNNSKIVGLKGTIVWTNSNPTSNFGQQTITLDANDGDMLLWIFQRNTSTQLVISVMAIKGYSTMGTTVDGSGASVRRGVIFSSGESYDINNAVIGSSTSNDFLIPLYVVSYKMGLF